MKWISVKDGLPEYGEPVLLKINKIIQNITYMRDGADDVADWFEPYHFDHEHEDTLYCHQASHWVLLAELEK